MNIDPIKEAEKRIEEALSWLETQTGAKVESLQLNCYTLEQGPETIARVEVKMMRMPGRGWYTRLQQKSGS